MKFIRSLLSICLFGGLLFQCGGNPEADGDAAYAQRKYNQALSYYLEVKKSQPENAKINEKIALTYMQKGSDLFEKRKNLDAFALNFEKGQQFIPDGEGSAQFNQSYSAILYQLALAHQNSKPSNEIQKEQFFSKTLQYLEESLIYNPDNMEADATLAEIKAANFQKMFDKGMSFFNKAKKEKNNGDLFLNAERFLQRAVSFDPQNADAQKNLLAVRKRTLSILDMDKDFPLAVGDFKYSGKFLLIAFTALNNSGEKLDFHPDRVKIIDEEDTEYEFDPSQSAKYNDGLTKMISLEPRKQIDGTMAFSINKPVKIKTLVYELESGIIIKKYFP